MNPLENVKLVTPNENLRPQILCRTRHRRGRGLEQDMKEKSKEFVEKGAAIYAKV